MRSQVVYIPSHTKQTFTYHKQVIIIFSADQCVIFVVNFQGSSLSSQERYDIKWHSKKKTIFSIRFIRNTCEGIDGIHYLMIKHLSPTSLTSLLTMYNRIYMNGELPTSWREALIHPTRQATFSKTIAREH